MEQRIAIVAIIIENPEAVAQVNAILHDHAELIVGRMGLPNVAPGVAVISLIVLGGGDGISSLSGKLGQLPGVVCNTVYSKHRVVHE